MGDIGVTKWDHTEINDKNRLGIFICESKKNKYLLKFGIRIYDDQFISLPPHAKLSWNWSAFLCGVLWMGYRKMYVELIVFSILIVLPYLFLPNITDLADTILTGFIWLFFGLLSNSFYFYYCKRKIIRIKNLNLSIYDELEALNQKGGTSVAGIFFGALTLLIAIAVQVIIRVY
jgi:hypothetical protein